MNEQTYTLVKISDSGRIHRTFRSEQRTWCGRGWAGLSSDLVMLKTVGAIEADPNRFLCERCFPPMLRRRAFDAFEAHRAEQADPAALLRKAGQIKRDFARTLVDNSGPPDRFIRWKSGEVWDWTPAAEHRMMFGQVLGHVRDTGDRPRPFPKPARPTLGLPHYHLPYRDKDFLTRLVKGVLAYRYWNTGECSVAVVAKEGGVADWGAYIGALPNRRPWVVEEHPVPNASSYVSEEEVVAHVVREGNKLTADEARVFFADSGGGSQGRVRGIALRGGQAGLPMEAYRP